MQHLLAKPRLRGVSHQYAFVLSLFAGCLLVWFSGGFLEGIVNGVFALSVCLLFGVSALYHRVQWSVAIRARMRRLDHCSIYILISGTYTPVMFAALDLAAAQKTLALVWGVSVVGILVELFFDRPPKWFTSLVFVGLGWVSIFFADTLLKSIGFDALLGLILSGLSYTIGAVAYAAKRPNPWPEVFGHHEIFHLFVIVGVAFDYIVIAFLI